MKNTTNNTELAAKIAAFWESTIERLQRYFNISYSNWTEELHDGEGTKRKHSVYEFIISPKKDWVFIMLNRLKGNVNNTDGCVDDFYHTGGFSKGCRCKLTLDYVSDSNEHIEYSAVTKAYLNGNTRVIISKIRYIQK